MRCNACNAGPTNPHRQFRAPKNLLPHPEASVRDIAAGTIREIEVFENSGDSYGYVLCGFQRP
jgi:hypothetical protein